MPPVAPVMTACFMGTPSSLYSFIIQQKKDGKKAKFCQSVLAKIDTSLHKEIPSSAKPGISCLLYTSRTRFLFDEFGEAFGGADEIIIADIFAARETDDGTVSAAQLADRIAQTGKSVRYVGYFAAIEAYLRYYDAYINSLVMYDEVGPDSQIHSYIDEDMKIQVQMKIVDALQNKWRKLI